MFLKPCGCLASAIVNVPDMFGELAKEQRYAKKHNYAYKLVETQEVREMDRLCDAHRVMKRLKGEE